MDVPHYEKVDLDNIDPQFSNDKEHRWSLFLPYKERKEGSILCVIGQNPSYADKDRCDKTLQYVEHLIYDKFPDVKGIIVLNLFSRVDPKKEKMGNMLPLQAARECRKWIKECNDFLIIYGKLSNSEPYRFRDRAKQLRKLLMGKNVLKLDISTKYAPHPRNIKIYYGNYCINLVKYNFEDIKIGARIEDA